MSATSSSTEAAAERDDRPTRSPRARWSAPSATCAARRPSTAQIFGDVSATLNAELEHSEGRSLIGLGHELLVPLARNTSQRQRACSAFALNGDKGKWRWTVTGNADLDARAHRHRPRQCSHFPRDRDARNDHVRRHHRDRQRQAVQASGRRCEHHADASAEARSTSTATGDRLGVVTDQLARRAPPAQRRSTSTCRSRAGTATSARSAI